MRRTSNKGTGKDARTEQPLAPGLDLTPEAAKRPAPLWDAPAAASFSPEEPPSTELDEDAPAALEGHEAEENAPDDALGLYLRQMGAIPLLNREQELALAQRLERKRNRYRRAALLNWYPAQGRGHLRAHRGRPAADRPEHRRRHDAQPQSRQDPRPHAAQPAHPQAHPPRPRRASPSSFASAPSRAAPGCGASCGCCSPSR